MPQITPVKSSIQDDYLGHFNCRRKFFFSCPIKSSFYFGMSKQQPQAKRGPGRPKTGVTKEIIKASMDKMIAAEARKIASTTGESFSQFVARAVHTAILQSR